MRLFLALISKILIDFSMRACTCVQIGLLWSDLLNPIKAGGGAFGPPPPLVFCPSTLIYDTITVKFFDFS